MQCSPPKDTDAYIHRSGRTGRAGRSGISVLFYSPRQESDLIQVERRAVSYFILCISFYFFVIKLKFVYKDKHNSLICIKPIN